MAVADEPATARQFPPQQARRLVAVDIPRPVRRLAVCRVHRQRPAADRLLQRRDPVSGVVQLSRGQVRRLRGAGRFSRLVRGQRGQRAWLDDLAADPVRQLDDNPQSADPPADAADLDAERGSVPRGAGEAGRKRRSRDCEAMQPSRAAVARLRSGRARHRRAPHLRLPHFNSVRTDSWPASRR